jgi:hypothetical protein
LRCITDSKVPENIKSSGDGAAPQIRGDGIELRRSPLELIQQHRRCRRQRVVWNEHHLGGHGRGLEHLEKGALLAHDHARSVANAKAQKCHRRFALFAPPTATSAMPARQKAGMGIGERGHPPAGKRQQTQS